MQYLNHYSGLSLQQIIIFLEVAEYESISKAAETLHITHSAVSKNIQNIENILELSLFIRNKQRLRLSPAGLTLKNDLKVIILQLEQIILKAHAAQQYEEHPLVIGLPSGVSANGYLLNMLKHYKEMYPGFKYMIEVFFYSELPKRLQHGDIDIAVSFGLDKKMYDNDFICETLFTCPWTVYMDKSNPLAQKDSLKISDLRNSEFLFPFSALGNTYSETILNLCKKHNFSPKISRLMHSIDLACTNITEDNQILLADPFSLVQNLRIVSKQLVNESTEIIIARKSGNVNFCAENFMKEMIRFYHT